MTEHAVLITFKSDWGDLPPLEGFRVLRYVGELNDFNADAFLDAEIDAVIARLRDGNPAEDPQWPLTWWLRGDWTVNFDSREELRACFAIKAIVDPERAAITLSALGTTDTTAMWAAKGRFSYGRIP